MTENTEVATTIEIALRAKDGSVNVMPLPEYLAGIETRLAALEDALPRMAAAVQRAAAKIGKDIEAVEGATAFANRAARRAAGRTGRR
ncbi:MAG: hypothetical protein AB7P02_00040 [Alphaproteobacteria bacterium]